MRGPQGSGQFRNASAGAIRVRSRRPTGNYSAQSPLDPRPLRRGQRTGRAPRIDPGLRGRGRVPDRPGLALLALRVSPQRRRSVYDQRLRECARHLATADASDARNPASPAQGDRGFHQPLRRARPHLHHPSGPLPNDGTSQIPAGLPRRSNDEHNWAARGHAGASTDGDRDEFELNGHGSRLDQHATFGQAMGTERFSASDRSDAGRTDVGGTTRSRTRPRSSCGSTAGRPPNSGIGPAPTATQSSSRRTSREAAARYPPLSRRLRSRGSDDARHLGLVPAPQRSSWRSDELFAIASV